MACERHPPPAPPLCLEKEDACGQEGRGFLFLAEKLHQAGEKGAGSGNEKYGLEQPLSSCSHLPCSWSLFVWGLLGSEVS